MRGELTKVCRDATRHLLMGIKERELFGLTIDLPDALALGLVGDRVLPSAVEFNRWPFGVGDGALERSLYALGAPVIENIHGHDATADGCLCGLGLTDRQRGQSLRAEFDCKILGHLMRVDAVLGVDGDIGQVYWCRDGCILMIRPQLITPTAYTNQA